MGAPGGRFFTLTKKDKTWLKTKVNSNDGNMPSFSDMLKSLGRKRKETPSEKIIQLEAFIENYNRISREIIDNANHQKYKRCLAMAKWCADVRELMHKLPVTDVDADRRRMEACKWIRKWRNRWLDIADKFKEKK